MKLHRNRFMVLLLFQIFAAVNAGVVFQIFERSTAGYVAGSVFVLVGFYSVYRFLGLKTLIGRLGLVVAGLHSLVAVVLLAKRLLTAPGVPVLDVFGIPMEIYHQGATYVFFALMIVTFITEIKLRMASAK